MARIFLGIAAALVAFGLMAMAGYYAYTGDYARATFDLILSWINFQLSDKLLCLSD